jgi:glycosyltransferase involved in cell wall biosynthesis
MRSPSDAPRRLHVVTLIDVVAEIGGAEVLAAELAARLDPERFERTLVVYRRLAEGSRERASQAAVIARLRGSGVRVLELEGSSRYDLRSWAPFWRLLRREDVDVIHAHLFGPNLWASLWTRLARVPVFVAHEHTWSYQGRPLRKLADRWVVAAASDVFLAVSEEDRRQMLSIERIPADVVRVLPNGIAPPAAPDGAALRAALGVPAEAPVVGSVGLLRPQKDFPTLIRAHAEVLARVPGAHLVIAGDGPEGPALERLVADLGVGASVTLAGFRPEGAALAAAFDVAASSSTFEGSSLAILEWMALGRPIAATAVGGTPDLLAHGAAGVLVAPSDPAALGEAIAGLLTDPERAAQLGAAARERQRAEYDLDVQVRRLEALYAELADGRLNGAGPAA